MTSLTPAFMQLRSELRATFLGLSVIVHLGFPLLAIWVASKLIGSGTDVDITLVQAGLFSGITSYAVMVVFQLLSECYTERIGGNFIRIRTLPNGVRNWMIGKTLFQELYFVVVMLMGAIGIVVFLNQLGIEATTLLKLIVLCVGVVLAFAPYGFMAGMAVRSVNGFMAMMLITMVLFGATSGIFPITDLPGWAQTISLISPFYWTGYAARALLVGPASGAVEVIGFSSLPLALGVMAVWGLVGWIVGPRVVYKMMQKETIGQLAKQRDDYRSKGGL